MYVPKSSLVADGTTHLHTYLYQEDERERLTNLVRNAALQIKKNVS